MMVTNLSDVPARQQKEMDSLTTKPDGGSPDNKDILLFMELKKKIMTFRDIFDIPPLNAPVPIHEPDFVPCLPTEKLKERNTHQALVCFYEVLRRIGDSSLAGESKVRDELKFGDVEKVPLDELAKTMVTLLDCINKEGTKERFESIDKDEQPKTNYLADSSPRTPTSVLSDSPKLEYGSYSPPRLSSLRAQAVKKLSPMGWGQLSLHMLLLNKMENQKIERTVGEEPKEEVETTVTRVKGPVSAMINEEKYDVSKDAKIVQHGPPQQAQVQLEAAFAALSQSPAAIASSLPEFLPIKPIDPEPQPQPQPWPLPPLATIESSLPILPPIKTILQPQQPPVSSPPTLSTISMASPPNTITPQQVLLGARPPPPPGAGLSLPPPPPGGAAPSPPPAIGLKGGTKAPPPPMPMRKGGGFPPPPPGAPKSRIEKTITILKRSANMGKLYMALKRKMEGSTLPGKTSKGKKIIGGGTNGSSGQGMADALKEMARRSPHFLKIEEDMEKHGKSIKELQAALNSFETKDMNELFKFHKQVESKLGILTDENQILARFEGFPFKKLEALRMAGALYNKLNGILSDLHNWKFESPLDQHLDKVEKYFSKIKLQLDALERSKEEDSKMLKSHGIHFDFHVLVKIKEASVDFSSRCVEVVMKERRAVKAVSNDQARAKLARQTKLLWKVFQFAYKVYMFAGGHDDKAENLTKELAQEIE